MFFKPGDFIIVSGDYSPNIKVNIRDMAERNGLGEFLSYCDINAKYACCLEYQCLNGNDRHGEKFWIGIYKCELYARL